MSRTGRRLAALALGGALLGCGPRRPALTGTSSPAWKGKALHVWVPTCDATSSDFRDLKTGLQARPVLAVGVGVVCRTFRSDGSLLLVGQSSTPTVQEQLRAIGARPTLVVANTGASGFDGALALAVLRDDAARTRLASDVVATYAEGGFAGIELDLEAMPTAAAPYYARLVSEVRARAPSVEISVDVHPKTVDDPGWEGPGAHDYRALSDAGAVLRLMTYDLSIGPVPPGPTTRATWIREVVAYARGKGVPASRLEIGLPAYGYDFPPKDKAAVTPAATPLRHGEALARLQKTGATLEHTPEGTPHFAYEASPGVRHEVWFDDAASLTRVLEDAAPIAAEVRGVAVWGVPGGDPALLDALSRLGLGGP